MGPTKTSIENEQMRHSSLHGETYVRKSIKLRRNEPCFCGSGLKYKKCHLEMQVIRKNTNSKYPVNQ